MQLSSELVEALIDAVADAHARGARLLVFKGEGKNFSAGFDFGNLEESSDGDLLIRFVRVESLLHVVATSPCASAQKVFSTYQGDREGGGAEGMISIRSEGPAKPD